MRLVKDGMAYELTNPTAIAAFKASGWTEEQPKAEQPKPRPKTRAKAKAAE